MDKSGRRCAERNRLEYHHNDRPYGRGGDHSLLNPSTRAARSQSSYFSDFGPPQCPRGGASYRFSLGKPLSDLFFPAECSAIIVFLANQVQRPLGSERYPFFVAHFAKTLGPDRLS